MSSYIGFELKVILFFLWWNSFLAFPDLCLTFSSFFGFMYVRMHAENRKGQDFPSRKASSFSFHCSQPPSLSVSRPCRWPQENTLTWSSQVRALHHISSLILPLPFPSGYPDMIFHVVSPCASLPGKALVIGRPPPVGWSRGLHPLSPLPKLHLSKNLPSPQPARLSWGRGSPNPKMHLQWPLYHHKLKIPARPAQPPAPSPKMVRTACSQAFSVIGIGLRYCANTTMSEGPWNPYLSTYFS